MRNSILTTVIIPSLICVFCSCQPSGSLHTGDLIFVGIPSDYRMEGMGEAIAAATGEGALNYIHTAIVEVSGDGVWVIDATLRHGVDRHPLDTFVRDFTLRDGSLPVFEVWRLKDPSLAEDYVRRAKTYLGEPYDEYFLPGNGAHYCTELVYDAYQDAGGPVFRCEPMNFKAPDGTMPVYWEQLFARLGRSVPQGVMGTNPQRMREDAALERVYPAGFFE